MRARRGCLCGLYCLLLAFAPLGPSPAADPISAETPSNAAVVEDRPAGNDFLVPTHRHLEEDALREKLDALVSVDVEDISLRDALHKILDPLKIQFVICEVEITGDGGSVDQQANLRLKEIPAWMALDLVLGPMELAWHPDETTLAITSPFLAEQRLATCIYDLEPLLRSVRGKWPAQFSAGDTEMMSVLQRVRDVLTRNLPLRIVGDEAWIDELLHQLGFQKQLRIDWSLMSGLTTALHGIDGYDGYHLPAIVGQRLVIRQSHAVQERIRELLSAIGAAVEDSGPEFRVAARRSPKNPARDAALQRALGERLDFQVSDFSLRDVLERLTNETGVQFHVLEAQIATDGGSIDQQVNLDLKDVRLETLLKRMLRDFDLAVCSDQGVLFVTTQSMAAERRYPVVYDLTGVDKIQNPAAVMRAIQTGTSGQWEDSDGVSSIMALVFGRLLVIHQTEEVHREVEEILHALRVSNAAPRNSTVKKASSAPVTTK